MVNIDTSVFNDRQMDVGLPPAGVHWIDFEVTLDADPSYRNVVRVPIRIEGSIDEYLTPMRDEKIEADLAAIPDAQLGYRFSTVDLPAKPFASALEALDETTLAIRLEVRDRDGVVRATGRAWWPSYDGRLISDGGTLRYIESVKIPIEWTTDVPERLESSDSWTLTIRGDPEVALSDFEATQYWAGQVEIPLMIPER